MFLYISLDCSIINAKLFFLYQMHLVPFCILVYGTRYVQKGARVQLGIGIEFSNNASGASWDFYSLHQSGDMPQTFRNVKLLIFFVDCNIIDAKLFFQQNSIVT